MPWLCKPTLKSKTLCPRPSRQSLEALLEQAGLERGSLAVETIEISYLTMLMFFGVETQRSGSKWASPSLKQSLWCFFPICF